VSLPGVATGPLKPFRRREYLFIAAFLFLVLPTVAALSFAQPIQEFCWQNLVGPKFRREFGFSTGLISTRAVPIEYRIFGITLVSRGGAFERSGVKAGDLLVEIQGRKTGLAAEVRPEQVGVRFYSALAEGKRGGALKLKVVSVTDLDQNWRDHVRSVEIRVP
jgi:hypothetical protein